MLHFESFWENASFWYSSRYDESSKVQKSSKAQGKSSKVKKNLSSNFEFNSNPFLLPRFMVDEAPQTPGLWLQQSVSLLEGSATASPWPVVGPTPLGDSFCMIPPRSFSSQLFVWKAARDGILDSPARNRQIPHTFEDGIRQALHGMVSGSVERFDIESYSDFQPNYQILEGSFSAVSDIESINAKFCKQIPILQHFSRSTRFAILCTAQIVKFQLKTHHNFGGFE